MSHGDIVTLTKDGIVAHEKSLRSIGIQDKSVCFGMWVANPYKEFDGDGNRLPPQLVISPFHPHSWAALLRMRITLNNKRGALYKITKLLSENNISFLHTECIPSGFRHSIWHVIAESTKSSIEKLKAEKEAFDREHPHVRGIYGGGEDCEKCAHYKKEEKTDKNTGEVILPKNCFDKARGIANDLATEMLKHAGELRSVLRDIIKTELEIKRIKQKLNGKVVKIYEQKKRKVNGQNEYYNEEIFLALRHTLKRLKNIKNGKYLKLFLKDCVAMEIFSPDAFLGKELKHKEIQNDHKEIQNDYEGLIVDEDFKIDFERFLILFHKFNTLKNQFADTRKRKEINEKLDKIFPILHSWETFDDLDYGHFLFDKRTVLDNIRMNKDVTKNYIEEKSNAGITKEKTGTNLTDSMTLEVNWNSLGDSYFNRGAEKPIYRLRYQTDMAFFAIYGGGRDVPILLKYDAKRSLLKVQNEQTFTESEWKDTLNIPTQFFANFDTQSKFIRFIPIAHSGLKPKLTNIDIEYKVTATKGKIAERSKGLFRDICELLQNVNINLMYTTNKNTRFEYNTHSGVLSFIAELDYYDKKEIKNLSVVLDKIPQDKYRTIKGINIYPNPTKKLFLSLHFGHPRDEQIRQIVKKVASERGFETTIIETSVDPVTAKVEEQIKSCDAFLQILTFRQDEIPIETNFNWLDFEYGLAFGVGIPTIRLVDIVRLSFKDWEQKNNINRDQRCLPFRTDVSDEKLTKEILNAIEELDKKLLKKEIT